MSPVGIPSMIAAKKNIGASRTEFRVPIDVSKRIITRVVTGRQFETEVYAVDISVKTPCRCLRLECHQD